MRMPHSVTSDALRRRARRSLGWDLGTVVNAYAQATDKVIAEIPGGSRGHLILAAVTHQTVGSQAALAEQIAVDPSILVRLLDDLEEAGLVARCTDPADRRNTRVVPTSQGRERYAALETKLRRAEDQILHGLTSAEQSIFRKLLARLATRANAAQPANCSRESPDVGP
jgi:MarR family transcriptional regulator for hemolysin